MLELECNAYILNKEMIYFAIEKKKVTIQDTFQMTCSEPLEAADLALYMHMLLISQMFTVEELLLSRC